jgi:hypothetical protein
MNFDCCCGGVHSHAIIAASATVEIDQHRGRAVDVTFLHQESIASGPKSMCVARHVDLPGAFDLIPHSGNFLSLKRGAMNCSTIAGMISTST